MEKKNPLRHSGSSDQQKVEVDLNNPHFLESWFVLDKSEKTRVLNTIEKLCKLTWTQVYQDPGLKWEAISHPPVTLPSGIDAAYSIRITQARRAVVFRERQFIRFLWIAEDHDATYPKR